MVCHAMIEVTPCKCRGACGILCDCSLETDLLSSFEVLEGGCGI